MPAAKGNQYARKAEQKVVLSVRIPPALMQTLLNLDGGQDFAATVTEVLEEGVTVLMNKALDAMAQEPPELYE